MLWRVLLHTAHGVALLWQMLCSTGPYVRRALAPQALASHARLRQQLLPTRGKIPHHLCLVVTEDRVHPRDVARATVWAMAAGVRHISLWDRQGGSAPCLAEGEAPVTAF